MWKFLLPPWSQALASPCVSLCRQKLLTFLPVKDEGGREWDKKKRGGGGGIWIGQWSECKKESGGRRRIKGERVDKNLSSLRSLLYNPECSLAGFLPAIKTFNFYQSFYCCYSSQHYLSALLLFSPAIEMSWSGCVCLWGGGEFF